MKMQPVESTQIAAIGHDPTRNALRIQFKDFKTKQPGNTYEYANFTVEDFEKFLAAESKGKHFGATIKKETAKHPYRKIGPEELASSGNK